MCFIFIAAVAFKNQRFVVVVFFDGFHPADIEGNAAFSKDFAHGFFGKVNKYKEADQE